MATHEGALPLSRFDELVYPDRCAVLVIDMQRDFCDPLLARRDVTMTGAMMPRLLQLLDAARAAHVRIIHVRTEHAEANDSDVSLLGPKWDGKTLPPLARPGTPGVAFMPGFEPIDGDFVITKHRYSGFIGTDLALVLRSQGIRTIVTTGVQTNNCVEATARDGMMLDNFVVFVGDATATYDQRLHDATLVTIANHYGEVATVDRLVRAWSRQPDRPNV